MCAGPKAGATVARMVEHDALHTTREAYDAVASTYADAFRDSLRDRPLDRAILGVFAEAVRESGGGPVADLGCGPGHVTAHLVARLSMPHTLLVLVRADSSIWRVKTSGRA